MKYIDSVLLFTKLCLASGKVGALFILVTIVVALSEAALAESMHDAVRKAVTSNPIGHAARSDVRATGNELLELRSEYLPKVDVFGEVGGQVVDNPNVLAVTDSGSLNATRQVGLSAEVTLFDGYRRANLIYRNAARLDGSIYRLLSTSETLALNAVEAYVDVVRHRRLVDIAKQNVNRHREIARQVHVQVEGGRSPVSDRFQVDERVLAAEDVKIDVERAWKDSEARYTRIIGHEPRGRMSIVGVKGLPDSLDTLIKSSIANNYQIHSADKLISEAGYERDVTRADRLPRVTLNGNTSIGGDRSGSRGREVEAFVGLRMSWSLYNGNARKRRLNALAERESEAAFQRDAAVLEVRELASRSWNSFQQGRKRSIILAKQAKVNRRIAENYIEEFKLSKRSLLDVLDAERARFNNEFQMVSADATFRFSQFRMMATQSRLITYFDISPQEISAQPTYEKRVTDRPRAIFNIDIEPLR